ncbi:phospholipase A2 inhibitor and Ly6/PLAUR domain-containing protein-like [Spea bombifrons]|uniref:phospholipase A2 inhibitor and Ly6/PLAUR domain-containing protein-like n=1 Tax=Spea bombifrons TaxID=233779 RepID=UPI00234BA480|nr:phospholipase A2 inhibitor and Ly6/PLAUR domain-containing protein-like [Spea bombifrons]
MRNPSKMESSLGILLAFLALAKTSNCLSCTVCLVKGATFCTGNNVTCPSGKVCVSTHTVSTEGGIKKNEFFGRTCMPQHYCDAPGSFSSRTMKSRKGISCCDTDRCIPPAPVLPDDSTQPNGVVCKTCTANDAEWCDTEETMKCVGNETKCILQITSMTGTLTQQSVLRGCATQSICNIGNESVITDGISVNVKISCTNSGFGLYCDFFFQTVAALVLIKMMFTSSH